ncbi:MAG: SDR family oxidoreductase [Myxococcales bacterium]|nr:SDR family oxidoreductase [Myxococcales bacterium]
MPSAMAGKSVVITGAASGIGRALAETFAAAGARVALLDVDLTGADQLAMQLEARGQRAMALRCDVRDADDCVNAIETVKRRWGGVDVLINNAGVAHRSPFARTDLQVIERVMDINFHGAVRCTAAALDSIVARRGVIVAISSVAGFAPLLGRSGYAASKHALHGFFDSLRAELHQSGASVLLVCPSFTRTAIDKHALDGAGTHTVAHKESAVGKLLEPDDVARAVLRAVVERRRQLVLSPVGVASYWLSRLLPSVYERVMRATQRAEA